MKDRRDNKAVAGLIGIFLLLVIAVITAGIYQQSVVPIQEENKEIEHQRTTVEQMQELRTGVITSSSESSKTSIELKMGIKYKNGLLGLLQSSFETPSPGTLISKRQQQQMKIKNADGLGSSQNYWIGETNSVCPDYCYETDLVEYIPDYRRQQLAPHIKYENSIVFSESQTLAGGKQIVPRTGQDIVNGRDISLTAISAPNINTSTTSQTSIDITPVSASSNTIRIENKTSEPIKIEIPTSINDTEVWENVLCNQFDSNYNATSPNCNTTDSSGGEDGYIIDMNTKKTAKDKIRAIVLKMEEGFVYNLKLSRINLMARSKRTSINNTEPAYVAWNSGDRLNLREGTVSEIPAQVRDKYNNPKVGIRTKATALVPNNTATTSDPKESLDCIGSFDVPESSLPIIENKKENCNNNPRYEQPGSRVSGDEGRLSYFYEVPEVENDVPIEVKIKVIEGKVLSNSINDKIKKVKRNLKKTAENTTKQPVDVNLRKFKHGVVPYNPDETDKSLRILDLRAPDKKVSVTNDYYLTAILENDGVEPIDLQNDILTKNSIHLINEDGIKYASDVVEPTEVKGSIEPGERIRFTFKMNFEESGLKYIEMVPTMKGEKSQFYLNVANKTSRIESYLIQNQGELEITNQRPSRFKDNDSEPQEDFEERNIPPFKIKNGSFIDTSSGDLSNFENFGNPLKSTNLESSTSGDDINIGIAYFRVPETPAYTIDINYTSGSGEAYKLNVVSSNGKETQDNIVLALPSGINNKQNRKFHLSPEQSRVIRNQNELFSVFNQTTGTSLDINKMELKTTNDIIKITNSNINLTNITANGKEPTRIKSKITNQGNESELFDVRLYKSRNISKTNVKSSTEFIPLKTKQININPESTKNISFKHYEEKPGTHTFRIGTENSNIVSKSY